MTFEEAEAAHRAGDFAAAERGYLGFPNMRNAVHNLGVIYRETGRLEASVAAFNRVLQDHPDLAVTRWGLARSLLALRRYSQAWPLHEARRDHFGYPDPIAGYPEWRGEPLAGRRLTVVAEQGFGDQMMFARYLPRLAAAGAQVTLACDQAVMGRFFERAGFATTAYVGPGQPLPPADFWTFIGSIPLRLGESAPPPPIYWPGSEGGEGVGVTTTGNPSYVGDARRSMRGAAAEQLLRLGRDLAPAATGARDFLDTAEIVTGLGLVVTIDSALAHVAGAMGKPCWVLLPAIGLDWRWNDGLASDWYPGARLIRQPADGDWSAVVATVRTDLGR